LVAFFWQLLPCKILFMVFQLFCVGMFKPFLSYLPNALSISRVILAGLLWVMPSHNMLITCIVWGGFSDFADGHLARRLGVATPLGAILDPIGDKCLIASLVIFIGWQGMLPLWWVYLTLGRDVLILLGGLIAKCHYGINEMPPTFMSKVNTCLQLGLLAMVVWSIPLVGLMIGITTGTTMVSGVEYGRIFRRMATKRAIL
jgi:cardiolipin synthase (CMP-forming)